METPFDDWRQFVMTSITLLQSEVKHFTEDCRKNLDILDSRLSGINTKLNNGLTNKIWTVEQDLKSAREDIKRIMQTQAAIKKWFTGVAAVLLVALICGFVGSYLSITTKVNQMEYRLEETKRSIR